MKKILLISLSLGIGLYVMLAIYVAHVTSPIQPIKTDTAIVLGAKSNIDHKYNPCLVSRVKGGISLYDKKLVSKLILSGGIDQEDKANEAKTMEKIALENGISSSTLLLEPNSTSTYENLVNSRKVMKDNNLRNTTIVTEPFHIARALLVAKSLGIETNYYPVPNSPCWKDKYLSKYFLKEPLAIMYYVIMGKIKLGAFIN